MFRYLVCVFGIWFLILSSSFTSFSAYAEVERSHQSIASEFLFEIGMGYYYEGSYQEAIKEFEKVLLIAPEHKMARMYLEEAQAALEARREEAKEKEILKAIEEAEGKLAEERRFWVGEEEIVKEEVVEEEVPRIEVPPRLEELPMVEELPSVEVERPILEEKPRVYEEKSERPSPIEISGECRMGFGATSDDLIWKRANWDLNEEDWRLLSTANYDYRHNTYDPAIYDRLRVNLDTEPEEGFGFHINLTLDPWSFVGKTSKATIQNSVGTDSVNIQLKWWCNNGLTIGEQFWTNNLGDVFSTPEIKVKDGKTSPTTVTGLGGSVYNIPEMDIHYMFRGLREAWLEYASMDTCKFRIFPIAYQDQALASDDPLMLADHHIYWEESQWLTRWKPGRYNSGPTPTDYTQGEFDDSLAWIARDSDGTRLTFLRGMSLDLTTPEDITVSASISSPMELWQDYETFDTYNGAIRIKAPAGDRWILGGLYTSKLGFDKNSLDAQNHVWAVDFAYQPVSGCELRGEAGVSYTEKDRSSSGFATDKTGAVAQISILTSSQEDILDKAYNEINPEEFEGEFFYKARAMFTYMGEDFNTELSTYHETRHDRFWSRHLHFNEPFDFYYLGLYEPTITWDDIKHQRLGDSIDTGRNVGALRLELENMLDGDLDCLFDLRNAHYTDGDYLETVGRLEGTYQATPKLTLKGLGIYHHKPDTTEDIDPYSFDADTGEFLTNTDIEGGKDPSVGTISFGGEYEFFPWLTGWGIYEYTNDITVAYDNFPRGPLNSSWLDTFVDDGDLYRYIVTGLYKQTYFALPPYPYYNVFKLGLELEPREELKIGIDWTRNEYEWAGQIDNNINHLGLDLSYRPTEKWNFYLRYVYSKWNDLYTLSTINEVHYDDHHNFFAEARYILSEDDMLLLQYGEIGRGVVSEFIFDPYGGTMTVLDTQHIVRLFYYRRF